MIEKSLGFIGGGRITRIILEGFKRKDISFQK
jgi:pyrroline-5-carboxylate reductase